MSGIHDGRTARPEWYAIGFKALGCLSRSCRLGVVDLLILDPGEHPYGALSALPVVVTEASFWPPSGEQHLP